GQAVGGQGDAGGTAGDEARGHQEQNDGQRIQSVAGQQGQGGQEQAAPLGGWGHGGHLLLETSMPHKKRKHRGIGAGRQSRLREKKMPRVRQKQPARDKIYSSRKGARGQGSDIEFLLPEHVRSGGLEKG